MVIGLTEPLNETTLEARLTLGLQLSDPIHSTYYLNQKELGFL